MENDVNSINTNLNENLILENKNIFKLDYENQNLNNNINYLNWKDSIPKEYGNEAKILKCKKCKILFYSKKEDIITQKPFYLKTCPICKKYICYFCSYYYNQCYNSFNDLHCCIKIALYIAFFISGPEYIKKNEIFDSNTLIFLIPIINIMGLFTRAFNICFLYLAKKESKNEGVLKHRDGDLFCLYKLMINLTGIILGIPYFLLDAYQILLLLFISIPFKFYPLKYYFGVLDVKMIYLK